MGKEKTQSLANTNDNNKRVENRRLRLAKRNRAMVARYYYWSEVKRRRFDDVIRILSENEFFVEERTINNALKELQVFYMKLYNGNVSLKQLKKEFPGWKW